MADDTELELIRSGDIEPDEVWKVVAPMLDTDRETDAKRIYGALRSWTWKALDRRRRDAALGSWAILLNNAQACLHVRFPDLAARLVALAELTHESLAVAALPVDGVVERKNVSEIMSCLAKRETDWTERRKLMDAVGLKAANATRLMGLLADVGYVEQCRQGREIAYRLSSEGRRHLPKAAPVKAGEKAVPAVSRAKVATDMGLGAMRFEYKHAVNRTLGAVGLSSAAARASRFDEHLEETEDALVRAIVLEPADETAHDGPDARDWMSVARFAAIHAAPAGH